MEAEKPFALTDEDRLSPLWSKLLGHLERRIQKLRIANDGDADERITANTRGQIKALLSIARLNKPRPELEPEQG